MTETTGAPRVAPAMTLPPSASPNVSPPVATVCTVRTEP